MIKLSIIIPLAKDDLTYKKLIPDLKKLAKNNEIIFVSTKDNKENNNILKIKNIKLLISKAGRAKSMNYGANKASGEYLWFLHADSKFTENTVSELLKAMRYYPDCLIYFQLGFLNDAIKLIKINEWGANFRSKVFKIPFGDQGFCIKKSLFKKAGSYNESLSYGEDHVFVWQVRQNNIKLHAINTKLYTSSRKYKKHGWLKTTFIHQYLWLKQAYPEWKKLRKIK